MSTSFSGGFASDEDRSFAVAAVMSEDGWQVRDLGEAALETLTDAAGALRNLRAERAAFALLNVDDDYFIILRAGAGSLRLLLSDATAAVTDDIAAEVFDELDLEIPDLDEDELEDVDAWAEGDLDILADLGVSEEMMATIAEDQSLWASEQIFAIAAELNFDEQLADVVGYSVDDDAFDD